MMRIFQPNNKLLGSQSRADEHLEAGGIPVCFRIDVLVS